MARQRNGTRQRNEALRQARERPGLTGTVLERQRGGRDGAAVAEVQGAGDGDDGSGHGRARAVGAAVAGGGGSGSGRQVAGEGNDMNLKSLPPSSFL